MGRFYPGLRLTLFTSFLVLSLGFSSSPKLEEKSPLMAHTPLTPRSRFQEIKSPKFSSSFPNLCTQSEPFSTSVNFALRASELAQSANNKEEWDEVARQWVQAVAWMQAVPTGSPRRAFAEKKVVEYMRNLTYSQQQASASRSRLTLASFNSHLLDEQLKLYLSYIASVGTPDILIVGSSRALQGVDPQKLQQSLAEQGYSELNIFNFGVNGATAQVVEFQLRELLLPEQLPKLIIWADGSRALNNGRDDRTYRGILNSEGAKRLMAGYHPRLPQTEARPVSFCYQFPQECPQTIPLIHSSSPNFSPSNYSFNPVVKPVNISSLNSPKEELEIANLTLMPIDELVRNIDAQGFLPISLRYHPKSYYQKRPLVSGRYDQDYQNFHLGGQQEKALKNVIKFIQERKIPLIFVNLPVTDDYLDHFRHQAERKFQQRMTFLARQGGFIFLDLSTAFPQKNDFFVDPSHLNQFGAKAVSERLAYHSSIPWPPSKKLYSKKAF